MKIEFDEKNIAVASAIATMLSTIAGEVAIAIDFTDIDPDNLKKATLGKDGEELPPPNDFGKKNTSTNLSPPDISGSGEDDGLDADKYPWDARINAKTHTKNADNTWKILRRPKKDFADDESWQAFIVSVRAELKGELPPPVTETKTVTEADEMSFAKLMKFVTGSQGKVTTEMLQEVCDSYEIAKPSDLGKAENKILLPSIYEELQEMMNE